MRKVRKPTRNRSFGDVMLVELCRRDLSYEQIKRLLNRYDGLQQRATSRRNHKKYWAAYFYYKVLDLLSYVQVNYNTPRREESDIHDSKC